MKTRVTITLDPEVHRLAKKQARVKKTTVSGLIQSLLESDRTMPKEDLLTSMIGSCTLRKPIKGTDSRYDYLKAKYLR